MLGTPVGERNVLSILHSVSRRAGATRVGRVVGLLTPEGRAGWIETRALVYLGGRFNPSAPTFPEFRQVEAAFRGNGGVWFESPDHPVADGADLAFLRAVAGGGGGRWDPR
ncbi:MAG: hypothetical protein L0323_21195 [Planctomycetes bacterium]|nr:hypothetical protein [Planctomycetota bacterium]